MLISLTFFPPAILTLCGCCCLSCIKALLIWFITTAGTPTTCQVNGMYPLLLFLDGKGSDIENGSANGDTISLQYQNVVDDF